MNKQIALHELALATQTAVMADPTTDVTVEAVPVAVAEGDGIGPEIMQATLAILSAAGARITPVPVRLGRAVCEAGTASGVAPESWETLRSTGVLLKGPITTPQGTGAKSVNVTLRKSLGLFANVRPCTAFAPHVATKHPGMDVVIVRENEEDLYAGIEHRQTDEVYQCLKLVSRPATERIVRYAFEYARAHGRKKVSCFSKDNIMKMTDGLFHKVFKEVAQDYPDIAHDHWIIDIGAARLAADPGRFDVIVTGNLYGDIISDIAAEVAGSVGLGASANIGEHGAMFEAIHGSAPDIAGTGKANPSGLLLAAVQMLDHLGQGDVAAKIRNAWLATIEAGVHTADIHKPGLSLEPVSTQGFAEAVIDRLGKLPLSLAPAVASTKAAAFKLPTIVRRAPARKELLGIDVFVHAAGIAPDALAERLLAAAGGQPVALTMVSNRGVKVWPQGQAQTFLTDHWRARFHFTVAGNASLPWQLLRALAMGGLEVVKTEQLYSFDGERGFSLGQGE
jgi:isocitrate dehydrogenase